MTDRIKALYYIINCAIPEADPEILYRNLIILGITDDEIQAAYKIFQQSDTVN